jgi:hypothetical protein
MTYPLFYVIEVYSHTHLQQTSPPLDTSFQSLFTYLEILILDFYATDTHKHIHIHSTDSPSKSIPTSDSFSGVAYLGDGSQRCRVMVW